jgi:preprotein translocase subunit YajC
LASLIPIILLFGVMYMLVIRPQQRRVREHSSFVSSLGLGDEVVTAGGVFGTISALRDDVVILDVAAGVSIKVLRSSITRRVNDDVPELDDVDDIDHLDDLDHPDDTEHHEARTTDDDAGPESR